MKSLEDIQEKLFSECKNLLVDLAYINDLQTLIDNKLKVDTLYEKISFLKILSESKEQLVFKNFENQNILPAEEENEEIIFEKIEEEEPKTEEPENIISEITPDSEFEEQKEIIPEIVEENLIETSQEEDVVLSESKILNIDNEVVEEVKQTEEPLPVSEEKPSEPATSQYFKDEFSEEHHHHEKKFKLAHIKGLKPIQSLFEDDFETVEKPSENSLMKSNIPTDYMEAPKPKMEFKLDLNDKIAFTKMLFGGSQMDLNEVVNKLNSFQTLEEAKEYLSDLYYDRNWKKVDDYAQRLWTLVENKFL